ncbi:hypothetical protein JOF56_008607 [Kibdelosporangium banguiense]|uniref:Alpha-galactosidase n=1 Tax=Kibdelosporangium banguiense TaxID=1365924 RepID=A0ABS4TUY2_9PSEU|nr:hypothetical protein [Kibdelosporangium banguiense]MBP2328222.1 hypothetical protein [Kibdelosporangium banguiense]
MCDEALARGMAVVRRLVNRFRCHRALLIVALPTAGLALAPVPYQPAGFAAPGSPAVTPPLGWNSDALRATGRPIVFSINPNSFHAITGDKYNWGEVADLWRTTEDLLDIWQNGNTNSYPMGVGNVVDVNAPLAAQAGPGHWNDPDMLVVGRPGLSLTESRSHFALWSLMAGNDIRTMSADVSAILRNPRLLAVNQDRLGAGGRRVRDDGATEVFAKPLSDGSVAVGLFNRGGGTATISATAAQIGLSGDSFTLTDLWTGSTSSSGGQITASVPAHGVAVYRVAGGSPCPARLRGFVAAVQDVASMSPTPRPPRARPW